MKKIRIIIVDDEEVMNKIKIEYLSKYDYIEICGVGINGKDGLDLIKEQNPNIVVTDNKMPLMNGTDVIDEVLNDDTIQPKPQFIIVTADSLIQYRQQSSQKRILDIINKNMGFDMINKRIEEILNEEYQIMNMPEEELTDYNIDCNKQDSKNNSSIFAKLRDKLKRS